MPPPLASSKGGGAFLSQGGASRFFTNSMIFLECSVIALFKAFYMFRDHNPQNQKKSIIECHLETPIK